MVSSEQRKGIGAELFSHLRAEVKFAPEKELNDFQQADPDAMGFDGQEGIDNEY